MIFVQEIEPGIFAPVDGDVITGTGDDAVRHPRAILTQWTAQELAEIGVHAVDPAPVPHGKIVLARSYIRPDDAIVEVLTLGDAPATADDLRAAIADRRWRGATGGGLRGGWAVSSDSEIQAQTPAE